MYALLKEIKKEATKKASLVISFLPSHLKHLDINVMWTNILLGNPFSRWISDF